MNRFNPLRNFPWSLTALLLLLAGPLSRADGAAARLDDAPPAVRAAAAKLVGGHELEGCVKGSQGGKTFYELHYKVGGTTYGARIGEDGEVFGHEVEVDLSAVPAAVLAAAGKKYPGGKIGESAIVAVGGRMFYELDVEAGDGVHEMRIGADGRVIADEAAESEPGKGEGAKNGAKAGGYAR